MSAFKIIMQLLVVLAWSRMLPSVMPWLIRKEVVFYRAHIWTS